MFTSSDKITSNAAEDFSFLHRAKAARYLLIHLSHSNIIFTLIVSKWHYGIFDKAQNIAFILNKPVEMEHEVLNEIFTLGVLGSS